MLSRPMRVCFCLAVRNSSFSTLCLCILLLHFISLLKYMFQYCLNNSPMGISFILGGLTLSHFTLPKSSIKIHNGAGRTRYVYSIIIHTFFIHTSPVNSSILQ